MWKTRLFPCFNGVFSVEKPVETVEKEAFSVLSDRFPNGSAEGF
jgi:hypothetical protein